MSLLQNRSVKTKSLSEQPHHDQPTALAQTLDAACKVQVTLSMLLLLHQRPRQTWALTPISESPMLSSMQRTGTGTDLKYISTQQKTSEVRRIVQGSIMKLTDKPS